MNIYRMTNLETGETKEGYADSFECEGRLLDRTTVLNYTNQKKIYFKKYKFEKIGQDDYRSPRKKRSFYGFQLTEKEQKKHEYKMNTANKKKRNMETEICKTNQKALRAGKSYGKYEADNSKKFYDQAYQEWLTRVLDGKRRFVCGR